MNPSTKICREGGHFSKALSLLLSLTLVFSLLSVFQTPSRAFADDNPQTAEEVVGAVDDTSGFDDEDAKNPDLPDIDLESNANFDSSSDTAASLSTQEALSESEFPIVTLADEPASGEGTAALPYLIASVGNLQWMAAQINNATTSATYNNKYYELTADIDLEGVVWSTMSPTNATSFKGSFDGKGYAIKNMTITATAGYQGFFGYTASPATIKNVTFANASVSGANYTAVIAGYATATAFTDIALINPIVASNGSYHAALAGCTTGASTVLNIAVTNASISGLSTNTSGGSYASGLVAYTIGTTTISNCFVTGTVICSAYPSGLVAYAAAAAINIKDCYVDVDVTAANGIAGGIVGQASPCTISNCLALGTVTGTTGAGGIVGAGTGAFVIKDSFALNTAVTVNGTVIPGGIVGSVPLTITYTLDNNYVFDGMKLKNNNTPEGESLIIIGSATDRFGGYVSKASLLSAATWANSGFSSTAWTIENDKAPILSAFAGNSAVVQAITFGSFIDNVLTVPTLTDANRWYYEDGKFKSTTEFTISTVEELAFLTQLVNGQSDSFSGRTVKLGANINLQEYCEASKAKGGWTPIGSTTAPFKGTFDGNGKKISNLSILSTANYLALFGSINGATIKDLALTELKVINNEAGQNIAGLAAQASGAASTISGCYVSGHVESGGNPVAGIVAAVSSGEIAITDCFMDGTVKGTSSVAGIVGSANGIPTIKNCIVMASIEGATTATNGNVAGIFGWTNGSQNVTIEGCRVLSENVNSSAPAAIYSYATGSSPIKVLDNVAWKGLKLAGSSLVDRLYNNPSAFDYAKNGNVLSWKLTAADGWSESFTKADGAWTYAEGKLPTLKKFASIMSDTFPDYMSDSLAKPAAATKTALASAVADAETLVASDYPDGWDDFSLSLSRAKLILNDDESSQAQVDAESKSLADARTLLQERHDLVFAGSGTEADPLIVSNVAELQKMNRVINATGATNIYRNKYYKLTADIDMDGQDWTPIGSASAAFAGVFDGNGKTIVNLAVSGSSYVALFGFVNGATIKDLILKDVKIENTASYAAGLVAAATGSSTISNCSVSGQISGKDNVGGIVGSAQAANASATITIEGCDVSAAISGNSGDSVIAANVGGIVGNLTATNNKVVIKNSSVLLSDIKTITAKGTNVGGIAGIGSNNITIEGCSVMGGSVKGDMYTGGLLGSTAYNQGANISSCIVQTNVESTTVNAGGLVGYIYGTSGNLTATGCAFNGTVRGTDYVGGLISNGSTYTLTSCFVGGDITGVRYIGGFLGGTNNTGAANGKIVSSYTTASVHGDTYVGGLVGYQTNNGPLSITDCRSLGEAVGYPQFGLADTVGALTGNAQYGTANFTMANTLSWKGLKLDKKTLAQTVPGDALYNVNRNGAAFLDWSLRISAGWPDAFTNGSGVWSYTTGGLPVLKNFADIMVSELPAYMADIPASGELADRTSLTTAIAAAQGLKSADYPEEQAMWSEFQSVLTYALVVYNFYDASQADVDSATDNLLSTITELDRLNSIKFASGDGTTASPFEIANLDQLLKLDRLFNSPDTTIKNKYRVLHYKLTADVDLVDNQWLPLGSSGNPAFAFAGSFDGGGKTISNMTVVGTQDQAFIGYTSGAAIVKNLTLKDAKVSGQTRVAGLVGYAAGASAGGAETGLTIENCHVSGTIDSTGNSTGGLVGYAFYGLTVKNSTASVDISARQSYVGGIAGYMDYGSIENCSVSNYTKNGSIKHNGNDYVGGIVGGVEAGNTNISTIKNCSVSANLLGTYVGGIIGYGTSGGAVADHLIVQGCYFDGVISPASASASAILGGIASTLQNNFRVTDCASSGTITTATSAGGILARFNGTLASDVNITNSYTTMRIGNSVSAGGIVGTISTTAGAGKLVISDSFALNEQVGATTNGSAIHAIGEGNAKLDYTLSGVKAWDGMLIVIDGEKQTSPSGDGAISYGNLQLATAWPDGFKSAPWIYTAGKLPVLTGFSSMSSNFPEFMTSTDEPIIIADTKALLAAINSADALSQAAYTAATWSILSEALSAAKTVLYSAKPTQSEVDAATTALVAAIDGLEYYREDTILKGDGSQESPYLIGSVADYDEMTRLMNISGTDLYLSSYYELTADIDLYGSMRSPLPYSTTTGTNGAIGFSGDFNGNGFTISNMGVRHVYYTGMFGVVKGAYIHDLNLANVDILGSNYNAGAIAGHVGDSVLENINVTGYVGGSSSTGGIVGTGIDSTMKNCHFDGTVELSQGFGYNLGGLAGQFYSLMQDCSFKGKVIYSGMQQSSVTMGGLVGFSGGDIIGCTVEGDILYTCYNDGIVRAGDTVGGIVGRFDGNSIVDCYYKGTIEVRGANNGGIAGEFRGNLIQGCVSEGLLDMNWFNDSLSPRPTGGIVGAIYTDAKGSVLIDDCESSMTIDGFQQAGGIAGIASGTGSLTFKDTRALNAMIFNINNNYYVNPFFYGEGSFGGTYTSENNYIWEGMIINGMTLAEWINQTYNEGRYSGANGFVIGPRPNDPNNPPDTGGDDNTNTDTDTDTGGIQLGGGYGTGTGAVTGTGSATDGAGTGTGNPAAPAGTSIPNAQTPLANQSQANPLVGSEVASTAPAFVQFFFDNPMMIPVGVLALAIIVGGCMFAFIRFKRETE